MEKFKKIIEEKYWWDSSMRLALLWADVALNDGADDIEVCGYLMEKVMGYKGAK